MVLIQHADPPGYDGGFLGVDLFFVLSGYLITGILLAEAESTGGIRVWRFLYRRAARLMPPLILVVLAVLAIGPYFWPDENLPAVALIATLYLYDFWGPIYGTWTALGHTWSLAVEEHFYMLWPLAVLGLSRLPRHSRALVLIAAFAAATLWRLANAYHFPIWEMTAYRLDTRLSGFIMGALICEISPSLKAGRANIIGFTCLFCLAILMAVSHSRDTIQAAYLAPIVNLAAAGLIVSVAAGKETGIFRLFAWPPAAYLGVISYSIYLWHWPIAFGIRTAFTENWLVVLPVTLVLSVGLAALSWIFVERPVQLWRRRTQVAW
jgi:peptidoglycan/LPS O-acetylase OafA/YrhL